MVVAVLFAVSACNGAPAHGRDDPPPPPAPPPPAREIVVQYDGADSTGVARGTAQAIITDLQAETPPLDVDPTPQPFRGSALTSAQVLEASTGAGGTRTQLVCDLVHAKLAGPVIRKIGSGNPADPDRVGNPITVRVPKQSATHPAGTRC